MLHHVILLVSVMLRHVTLLVNTMPYQVTLLLNVTLYHVRLLVNAYFIVSECNAISCHFQVSSSQHTSIIPQRAIQLTSNVRSI